MKKILLLLIFTTSLLVACHSSIPSMSEINVVPSRVQDKIDSNYTLQLIYDGENIAYLVYQSKGTVTTDLETLGNTLKIKLDVTDSQDGVIEQHVYKLTLDPKNEDRAIDILINGKSTPIDNVTG